jgi:sialate O-acetylesterase
MVTAAVDPVFVGDLWILAGQSNMEGCGKLIDCDPPQPGISCFYMGDRWDIAQDPLCWLNESLDPVNWAVPFEKLEQAVRTFRRDRTHGGGLAIPFAKEMTRHTGVPIGFIMCAHGGTSMMQWDPELAGGDGGGHCLYGAMLRKVRKLGGKVKGCLWYQGESDANEDAEPLYAGRMKAFVNRLRRDVMDSNLPFIYAQLSVFYVMEGDCRWWNRIQHDQLRLETEIDRAAMVVTIDATMSDAIHLDTNSLRQAGRRMAWQALRLAHGMKIIEPGPRPERYDWNPDRTELRLAFVGVNGRLDKVDKAYGFHVEANGEFQPFTAILSPDGMHIRFLFERPVPLNAQITHGCGFNPTVNVRDAQGIPLCVFGPVDV